MMNACLARRSIGGRFVAASRSSASLFRSLRTTANGDANMNALKILCSTTTPTDIVAYPFSSPPSASSSFSSSTATDDLATKAPTARRSSYNNSAVPRTAISMLGAVNAGKSVLMNLLTQSDTSLVHDTRGTTADPKACLMELHGRIGPVRLLDTPGVDESGELGQIKRHRAFDAVGKSDVAIVVADPFEREATVRSVPELLRQIQHRQHLNQLAQEESAEAEKPAMATGASSKQHARPVPIPLLIYNLRKDKVTELESKGGSVSMLLEDLEKQIINNMTADDDKDDGASSGGDDKRKISKKAPQAPPSLPPTLAVDFTDIDMASRDRVIDFLERHTDPRPSTISVLPDWLARDRHAETGASPTVFLNIPMDQQTPAFRLLRPQAMIQEALIRNFVSTHAYRMDMGLARSDDPADRQREKGRFLRAIEPLLKSGDLSLLVTDSQAIDVVAPWTLDDSTGEEIVPITTFSIAMIRYLSGGRLSYFADGLRKLDEMVSGEAEPKDDKSGKWRVLVTEACNHTRLNMEKECADIGTVQLPNHLGSVLGKDNVEFEFAFGKHVIFNPARFDLVVHCGGCMLNPQQMDARVADLVAAGVPATNYGLLLSRIQSPQTLCRVLKPWGITYDYEKGKCQSSAAQKTEIAS